MSLSIKNLIFEIVCLTNQQFLDRSRSSNPCLGSVVPTIYFNIISGDYITCNAGEITFDDNIVTILRNYCQLESTPTSSEDDTI